MENKLRDMIQDFSYEDAEKLDGSFENFSENAKITDEERNRILSAVMRKAGYDMKENLTNTNNTPENGKKKNVIFIRRFSAVLVAAAIMFGMMSLLVSADVGQTHEILYHLSPALAQSLKPVNRSCESEGIEMNVISANIDGDTAYVYVSLHDKEGDRIDETIDLFDSYSIYTSFDAACHCSMEKFDAAEKTAYFLITVSSMDGRNIENMKKSKITFYVKQFVYNKHEFKDTLTDIDLSSVSKESEAAVRNDFRGVSGSVDPENDPDPEKLPCLISSDTPLCVPTDGVQITGIGYVDGQLHVQTHFDDVMNYDNFGWSYFVDKNGNEIYNTMSFSYYDKDNENGCYNEDIYDIPYEELTSYTMYGEYITGNSKVEGNWKVTFRLEDN